MNAAHYIPGSWAVVVAPHGIAVLGGDVPADVVSRVSERLSAGGGLGAVLESLTGAFGTSLTAIPPFAVALTEGDAVRVAVRGDIAVRITADVDETVTGAGVTTWSERVIAGARALDVTMPGETSGHTAWFPIAGGIVLASAVRVELGSVAPASRPEPASPPEAASPRAEPPAVPPMTASASASAPAPAPASAPTPGSAGADETPEGSGLIDSAAVLAAADGDTWMPLDSTLAHSAERVPEATPSVTGAPDSPAPSAEPELAGEYDDVWGATIARPVEETVHTDEPAGAEPAPAPAVPEAPASIAAEGDHDGATISLAQARALRDSAPSVPGAPDAPAAVSTGDSDAALTVPTMAAAAHPIAPPLIAPPLITPPLIAPQGTIRLSTGQVVVLDRTVVIGRRPRSTRVSGTELPHLIAVDSPEQDISRSHVEIRPEGDSVVVVDLHTTNGTTLLRAGVEPVRLHPGEHTVVVSGDVIDLGDGITVAFEDLP